ncbi:MAG: hypothetical protein GF346_13165, partial [Candidatus Eisenbacteria bacterium]|nr:hypothetical protein [Candidatus Latescibacterota bacterium]MBD3303389.1 hypothetical protein [Candidatus Eisenbacteria bacterium]
MRFAPDAESEKLREEAVRAAAEICAPEAARRDETRAFPREEIRRLGTGGWLGMYERDRFATGLAIAELSRACASIGLLVGFHNLLVCDGIARSGTQEARESFLPRLTKGDLLGAVALSDPATTRPGEEPAQAVLTDEGYRLRGTKPFVPGAVGADLFLVYAY